MSPYFMVYGAKAVLPSDVNFRSPMANHFDELGANKSRELEINCIEERCLDFGV